MALQRLNNETEVLAHIAKGDEMAFATLFRAYHNQLSEFVQLLTRDRDSTAEIVQEVFAKVWINRESLPMVNNFDAYLFILCRNHTLNHIRKWVVERERQEAYLREVEWVEPWEKEEISYDPHELVERAVRQLPPQQQRVFSLRQQGYRNPEISRQMNLSIDSVKKYQHLALKFISEFVKAEVVISAILAVCWY
ncbi:sigma-70 family RNA polymerase sigma factor [Parapedobacter sp. 2B3]|uniref:sigma-70 family RNA polymerase sigma factor n=1 Tax=Parapedobacter sp. 2B3 TaxID=3342381 RepID=UPI0035B68D84